MGVAAAPAGQLAARFQHVIPDHDGVGVLGPNGRVPHLDRVDDVVGEAEVVLADRVVGRQMDAEVLLHRQDPGVALVADVIEALVVVGLGRDDVAVATMGGPFGAVQQDDLVGLELGIGPGVMGYVAVDMVVVVGDVDEVDPIGLGEADDLLHRIVGRLRAVARVQVQVALQPDAIGQAGHGRDRGCGEGG